MDESEKIYPRSFKERMHEYLYDHSASLFINSCFAIIVLIVVAITVCAVYATSKQDETAPQQSVVKVYLNENDSIIPILKDEMNALKSKLDSIRQDSLAVEISKIKR